MKGLRDEIERRWNEIDRELAELWGGRACADPIPPDARLLREQDALVYEAGLLYFERRDHHPARAETFSCIAPERSFRNVSKSSFVAASKADLGIRFDANRSSSFAPATLATSFR